jgi:hypothetical protein
MIIDNDAVYGASEVLSLYDKISAQEDEIEQLKAEIEHWRTVAKSNSEIAEQAVRERDIARQQTKELNIENQRLLRLISASPELTTTEMVRQQAQRLHQVIQEQEKAPR